MARLQTATRTLEAVVRAGTDPKVAAKEVARFHRRGVAEVEADYRRVLGSVPPSEDIVDGRKGASLESVRLDGGVIVTRWEAITEVVDYTWGLIVQHSPVLTGNYRNSHRLFADGVEVEPGSDTEAREWVILSALPYSRKIEKGQGSAPDNGVYEGAAQMAKSRFGNVANIRFVFESISEVPADLRGAAKRKAQSGARFPAIKITLR